MAIRPILIHPDPRLRKASESIASVDDEVRRLVDDMFETMYAAPGIGLAAPQIGVLKRVFVIDCAARAAGDRGEATAGVSDPLAMINPQIEWRSEEERTEEEGCLSIPDQFDDVTRPEAIKISFLDREGVRQERDFDGIYATCFQHELDHLDGKLFIDYLGPVRRAMITTKMKKLKRERAKEKAAKPR